MPSGLEQLVTELRAAGEVSRLRILDLLSAGELSVGELAQVMGQSQPRLSRHLKLLNAAGLIERMPEGAWVFYRLPTSGPQRELIDVLCAEIDPKDPSRLRDRERLEQVRADRTTTAQLYFSRVAEQWDRLRALQYEESKVEAAILEAAGEGPFDLVVDFGTGTGRMLALFSPRADRVEGIDLSHQMLTVARSNLRDAKAENAAVRHGDVTAAPYESDSADLVIIHQVLHYLDDPSRAIAEAARVLKPGGRLLVIDFAPHGLEALRAEHAHRHLGVSESDFRSWTQSAGLKLTDRRSFEPPSQPADQPEGVAVNLWVADLGAAPRQKAA